MKYVNGQDNVTYFALSCFVKMEKINEKTDKRNGKWEMC